MTAFRFEFKNFFNFVIEAETYEKALQRMNKFRKRGYKLK